MDSKNYLETPPGMGHSKSSPSNSSNFQESSPSSSQLSTPVFNAEPVYVSVSTLSGQPSYGQSYYGQTKQHIDYIPAITYASSFPHSHNLEHPPVIPLDPKLQGLGFGAYPPQELTFPTQPVQISLTEYKTNVNAGFIPGCIGGFCCGICCSIISKLRENGPLGLISIYFFQPPHIPEGGNRTPAFVGKAKQIGVFYGVSAGIAV
ncbi:hypothetical protein HK096_009530, partial [Nowakowskiella sp. JEL0078]